MLMLAGFILSTQLSTSPGSLGALFKPLEYIDISALYDHYSMLIDLIIYLLIFVGLAQITLGQRFSGRGRKAITIGIGLTLALSLATAEKFLGFSIRSFGPIAAGIFLAVLGMMIYRLIKHFGAGFAVSSSLAYIIVLLSVVATVPGFFKWVNDAMPMLNLGLLVGFFIACYNIIAHLFRHKSISERFGRKLEELKKNSNKITSSLDRSENSQKDQIKPITNKAFKSSTQILSELLEILKSIERYAQIPEARKVIKEQIDRILPEQMELTEQLKRLQILHNRVLSFDLSMYSNQAQARFRELSENEKGPFKKEILSLYAKLGVEKQLQELEQRIQSYQGGIKTCLQQASACLISGDIPKTKEFIQKAISLEKGTVSIIEKLTILEKQILEHTRKEVALERHTAAFQTS
jgi:hypothetical protein